MEITLVPYTPEQEPVMVNLIQGFWWSHNHYRQPEEDAKADLSAWTAEGHRLYFIRADGQPVGLLHLGSRGVECDWLEDLFVLPEYQNRGIGSQAVHLAEALVRQYSSSMYIEAAARNARAIALYRRLGYDCLNTVTVRKDFPGHEYNVLGQETVRGQAFEAREDKVEEG